MVLIGIICAVVMEAEVPPKADLEEDEVTVLAVKGFGVRGEVRWPSVGVVDVQGSSRSCCP